MRDFGRLSFKRVIGQAAIVAGGALLASCAEETGGPNTPRQGLFQLLPQFESSVPSGLVQLDRVRVVLTGQDREKPALDTLLRVDPANGEVDLNLAVPVLTSADTFVAVIALITPAGDTAFRGGPLKVVARTRSRTLEAPVVIPFVYTGVGANADSVAIIAHAPSLFSGDTLEFEAVAYENGVPVPGTPVGWVSLDPVKASVPEAATGKVVGNQVRGVARVMARLINGPADTTQVAIDLPPAAITLPSGNLQIARVGSTLPQPLVVRVIAADNVPVPGVWVRFSAPSGTLSADSARTDSAGRATVQFTLGSSNGPQTVRVSSERLPGSEPLFTVTAVPQAVAVVWTAVTGGVWSNVANWSTGLLPGPLDTVLINLGGTYSVTIDQAVNIAGLIVGAATGTQTLSANGRTLAIAGVSAIGANGVLSLANSTLSGTNLLANSGTLKLNGTTVGTPVDNRGVVLVNGITMLNGTLVTSAGSILRVQGNGGIGGLLKVAGGFTNNGTIELTDVAGQSAAQLDVLTGTLVNASAGTIVSVLSGGGTRSLNVQLDNQGLVKVNHPLTVARGGVTHINSGTLDIKAGNLSFAGPLQLLTTSNLTIYATGPSQSTGLQVSGAMTLGGDLNLDFSAHQPTLLEQLTPVVYSSRSGGFRATNGLGLVGLLLNVVAGLTSVVVTFL